MLKYSFIAALGWFGFHKLSKSLINKKYHNYILSITNGILMTYLSSKQLLKNDLDDKMNKEQNLILDVIRGYFIYDGIDVILKKDYIYSIHHIISIHFMNFFEKYKLGKIFIQSLLLGEITNPMLNYWTLTKELKYEKQFRITNHIFTPFFLMVRGVAMPIYFYNTLKYLKNNENVSRLDFHTISIISILFNCGNYFWGYNLLRGYIKWIKK